MSSVSDIKYQAWHASSVTCVLPHKPNPRLYSHYCVSHKQ